MDTGMPDYKTIWRISLPIIISLVAQNLINVIDTAFLGRIGEVELGAAAIAGLFYFILYMVGFGFGTGAQIMIGRRNGEKNFGDIGKIMDQGLYFLLAAAVAVYVLMTFFSEPLMAMMMKSPNVLAASNKYLDIRMYGIFLSYVNVMFRSFYVGITRTNVLLYNAILMAIVNIILDYLLIFGHFGFPAMGIEGAALASVISEGVAMLYLILFSAGATKLKKYELFHLPGIDFLLIRRIMKISVFVMLQFFVSMSAWFTFFLIIEKMGERPLAISNIVRSAYMLMIIPVFGFGSTASTLVSNSIGEGRPDLVLKIINKITGLCIMVIVVIAIPAIMVPHLVVSVFTSDPGLVEATIPSIYVILGALVMFSFTMIYFQAISGTGNTSMAMYIEFITLFIYLALTYYLAISLKLPLEIVWMSEYVYALLLGGMSFIYLKSGNWKSKTI